MKKVIFIALSISTMLLVVSLNFSMIVNGKSQNLSVCLLSSFAQSNSESGNGPCDEDWDGDGIPNCIDGTPGEDPGNIYSSNFDWNYFLNNIVDGTVQVLDFNFSAELSYYSESYDSVTVVAPNGVQKTYHGEAKKSVVFKLKLY